MRFGYGILSGRKLLPSSVAVGVEHPCPSLRLPGLRRKRDGLNLQRLEREDLRNAGKQRVRLIRMALQTTNKKKKQQNKQTNKHTQKTNKREVDLPGNDVHPHFIR